MSGINIRSLSVTRSYIIHYGMYHDKVLSIACGVT